MCLPRDNVSQQIRKWFRGRADSLDEETRGTHPITGQLEGGQLDGIEPP